MAGATADTDVADTTVNDDAATPPKCTAVAPVKLAPVIVTEVPPAVGPQLGLTPVTPGAEDATHGTLPESVVAPPVVWKLKSALVAWSVSFRSPNCVPEAARFAADPRVSMLTPPVPTMNSVTPLAAGAPLGSWAANLS